MYILYSLPCGENLNVGNEFMKWGLFSDNFFFLITF